MCRSSLRRLTLAEDSSQPTIVFPKKDAVSYRRHFIRFNSTFLLGHGFLFDGGYAYRRKDFTSDLAGDSHYGVLDTTHAGSAELRDRLSSAAAITVEFLGAQRCSSA